MDVILIPGLWLDGSVWDGTATALRSAGGTVQALTLPGAGPADAGAAGVTLQDQRDAVLAAVDRAAHPPVVVGHSAAATLAWMAADARADRVAAVVLIGGFPTKDGEPYAPFFERVDGVMAFPGWQPFEGPDSADLDQQTRDRIAEQARPVPQGVAEGIVQLSDERRYDVPVTLICPEFSPEDAREWIAAGDVPELAKARRLTMVDIDSGHWPMVTRPQELADLILAVPTAD